MIWVATYFPYSTNYYDRAGFTSEEKAWEWICPNCPERDENSDEVCACTSEWAVIPIDEFYEQLISEIVSNELELNDLNQMDFDDGTLQRAISRKEMLLRRKPLMEMMFKVQKYLTKGRRARSRRQNVA